MIGLLPNGWLAAERLVRAKATVYLWLRECPHLDGRPLDWRTRSLKAGNTVRTVTVLNPDEIETIRKRLVGKMDVSDGRFEFVRGKQFVFRNSEGSWGFVLDRYQLHPSTLRNWGQREIVRSTRVSLPAEVKHRHKMQRVYHLDDLNRKVTTGKPTRQPPIRDVYVDRDGEMWLPNYLAMSWYRLPLKPHTLRDQARVRAKRVPFEDAKGRWSRMRWVYCERDLQREARAGLSGTSQAERARIRRTAAHQRTACRGVDGSRKPHRPYKTANDPNDDRDLYDKWQAARKQGLTKAQFSAREKRPEKDVKAALDRERKRR